MAPKKTGLGKGLDGMFPSYASRKKTVKDTDSSRTEKETKKESKGQAADDEKTINSSSDAAAVASSDATAKGSSETAVNALSESSANGSSGTAAKDSSESRTDSSSETAAKGSSELQDENVSDSSDSASGASTTDEPAASSSAYNNIASEFTDAALDKSKDVNNGEVLQMRTSEIEPNRDQPRRRFDEDSLTELAESIRQYGIIQPLIVQKKDDHYEIIAGERRWRAARLAGLREVPVIIRDYTDREVVEVSLIENIQRENLNPIEEAKAYERLLDEFELKQDEVAERVSKSRSTITNALRLLKLDARVQQMLIDEMISAGHARALLAIEDKELQYQIASRIFDEKLSVRDIEKIVRSLDQKTKNSKKNKQKTESLSSILIYQDMEEKMRNVFGTKVTVNRKSDSKGKIEIEYYSQEELERIYDLVRSVSVQ